MSARRRRKHLLSGLRQWRVAAQGLVVAFLVIFLTVPAPRAEKISVANSWKQTLTAAIERMDGLLYAIEKDVSRLEREQGEAGRQAGSNPQCFRTDCAALLDLLNRAMQADRDMADAQSLARVAREHFEQVIESDEGLQRRLAGILGDVKGTQALRRVFVEAGNIAGAILASQLTGKPTDISQAMKQAAAALLDYGVAKGADYLTGVPSAVGQAAGRTTENAVLSGMVRSLSANAVTPGGFRVEKGRFLFSPRLGAFDVNPRRKEVIDPGAVVSATIEALIAGLTEGSIRAGARDIRKAQKALADVLRLRADYAGALNAHRTLAPRLKALRMRSLDLESRLRRLAEACQENRSTTRAARAYSEAMAAAARIRDARIEKAEKQLRRAADRLRALKEERERLWQERFRIHRERMRKKGALSQAESLWENRETDREIAQSPYASAGARKRALTRLEEARRLGRPEDLRREVAALERRKQENLTRMKANEQALQAARKALNRASEQARRERQAARKAWRDAVTRAEGERIRSAAGRPVVPGRDYKATRYEDLRRRFELDARRDDRNLVTLPTPEEIFAASQASFEALRQAVAATHLKVRGKNGEGCGPDEGTAARDGARPAPKELEGRGGGVLGTFRFRLEGAVQIFANVMLDVDPASCNGCRGMIRMLVDNDLDGTFAEAGEMNAVFARIDEQLLSSPAIVPAQQGKFRVGHVSARDFALRIVIEGVKLDSLRWRLRVEDERIYPAEEAATVPALPVPPPVPAPTIGMPAPPLAPPPPPKP